LPRPDDDAINEEISRAYDKDGRYPGMTYESGVRDALSWVLGETDEAPLEDA
jgi:hypothetical protein